jgi:regulator of protease activity HflC (stomatin/prohibitin superfamily)
MDILHLIDQLETLLNEGSHPPLVGKRVLIDEQRAWEIIDQMRVSIPEEVKKAKRINQERDRIMAQANEEAARTVDLARDEAQQLASDTEVVKQAQQRAQTILERAQREADALKADADDYTIQTLSKLEEDLAKALSIVRNGLLKLNSEKAYQNQD